MGDRMRISGPSIWRAGSVYDVINNNAGGVPYGLRGRLFEAKPGKLGTGNQSIATREVKGASRSLFGVPRRLFDKHHRYLISDRIYERTVGIHAFESGLGLIDLQPGLALGAAEYLEQFRTDRHFLHPFKLSSALWAELGTGREFMLAIGATRLVLRCTAF